MQRTAWITLRHEPPYRSEAFASGLEKSGFTPRLQFPEVGQVKTGDVVVVWNLNPRYRSPARLAKAVGASLIVAENGYITKRRDLTAYYALARDGHNGSGFWHVGPGARWPLLDRGFGKWRTEGEYILVADQRGIGSETMACPRNFADTIGERIKKVFIKAGQKAPPVVIRRHPGRHSATRPLAEDLRNARAVVVWASNVGNLSCLSGIPTFRCAPYHVNEALHDDLSLLPNPPEPDRAAAFEKLAWAQWSLAEIHNGVAFRSLLRDVL